MKRPEPKTLRTLEQARTWFPQHGISIASWAVERGFNVHLVYDVLHGRNKGTFGQSHRIAVALGLKPEPMDSIAA